MPNSEVAQRDLRQRRDPSRVDSSSHPGNDSHLAGALESKRERKRFSLHQISSEPEQCEMALSRLKRDLGLSWYVNSFRGGCGFAPAMNEKGVA